MPYTKKNKKLDSTTKDWAIKKQKKSPSVVGSGTAKKAEKAIRSRHKMLQEI